MSKLVTRERCPLCATEGRDHTGDNLAIYDDGHQFCFAGHGLIKGNKEDFILDGFTYEYLPHRGLSKRVLQFYDIKTKIDTEGKPVSDGFQYEGFVKVKNWELDKQGDKKIYIVGQAKAGLFAKDKFSAGSHKTVTITEGEHDAASLADVLWSDGFSSPPPVVSVQSASTAVRDCVADRSWLNAFDKINLCFDTDVAGRRACEEVARLFDYNKVFVTRLTKHKDANDYLQAGDGDELRKIWWNSKQYMPENIKSSFTEFKDILTSPRKVGIPYPWKILNDMTYGIRTGETVLITAQEKVGKTELMHFIEHQILKETDDNVGAIFLEETPQRHLHALAGIELKDSVHLPNTTRTSDEIIGACEKVIRRDGRLHIYSHFGSDDPVRFLDTIRFLATARACRYILLDHISMVVSGVAAGEGDERKQLDYLATRLEMMVKELDIALIMVSHVNDFGQTRGSRYLTKVSDTTINATRDTLHPDPEKRNTINLTIPYNRFPGTTGNAGGLVFDRDTYSFTEVEANDNLQGSDRIQGNSLELAA